MLVLGGVFISFVLQKSPKISKICGQAEVAASYGNKTCLVPKRRVDRLSDAFDELGEQQERSAVLEFPPCSTDNYLENK